MNPSSPNSVPKPATKIAFPDTWAPNEPGKILRELFDRIQRDCSIDRNQWARLVDSYIVRNSIAKGVPCSNLVEERSSLNKKLKGNDNTMTIKSFVDGLLLLRAKRFRIAVTIESATGSFTDHGVWVNASTALEFDPSLDRGISIPREVSLLDSVLNETIATRVSTDHREPPPDLSALRGNYPSSTDSSGDLG